MAREQYVAESATPAAARFEIEMGGNDPDLIHEEPSAMHGVRKVEDLELEV